MKILRFALSGLLAIALGLLVVVAQSNPPTPSGGEKSEKPKRESGSDKEKASILQRGSEDSPLLVKLVETPIQKPEPEKSQTKTNWKADANWWVAVFTAGLIVTGLVQIVFFCWQLKIIRRSQLDTRLAAKAATRSTHLMEITAKRQLRAYVQVVPFRLYGFRTEEPGRTGLVKIDLRIDNFGQTPAKTFTVRGSAFVAPNPLPPDCPVPPISGKLVPPMTIFPNSGLADDRKSKIGVTFQEPLLNAASELIGKREAMLYILGSGEYLDVFNDKHTFDFCCGVDCQGADWLNAVQNSSDYSIPVRAIMAPRGNRFDKEEQAN